MTEARFDDAGQLARAAMRAAGIEGEATVVKDGCTTTFTARVNADSDPAAAASGIEALLEDPGAYRFALTAGRFVAADGFTIDDDGTIARPDARKTPVDGALTVTLTWIDDVCGARPWTRPAPRRI
jgi:hypothetical protein